MIGNASAASNSLREPYRYRIPRTAATFVRVARCDFVPQVIPVEATDSDFFRDTEGMVGVLYRRVHEAGVYTFRYRYKAEAPPQTLVRRVGTRCVSTGFRGAEVSIDEACALVLGVTEQDLELVSAKRAVAFLERKPYTKLAFDHVRLLHPDASKFYLGKGTEHLISITYDVAPSYPCEWTLEEDAATANFRENQIIGSSTNLARDPSPALSYRFHHLRQNLGTTTGKQLIMGKLTEVLPEVIRLEDQHGFVEIENFKLDRVMIRYEDAYTIKLGSELRTLKKDDVLAFLDKFLLEGTDAANAWILEHD